MKISELVTLLETLKETHGDIAVYVDRDTGVYEIKGKWIEYNEAHFDKHLSAWNLPENICL